MTVRDLKKILEEYDDTWTIGVAYFGSTYFLVKVCPDAIPGFPDEATENGQNFHRVCQISFDWEGSERAKSTFDGTVKN